MVREENKIEKEIEKNMVNTKKTEEKERNAGTVY